MQPTGDSPTISELSAIVLLTKLRLILWGLHQMLSVSLSTLRLLALRKIDSEILILDFDYLTKWDIKERISST